MPVVLLIAILLQWVLRGVAEPLSYVDLPLIVVVFAALQRNSIRALLFATIAGISIDALSGGLLGAGGFSKTLTAYIVSEIARRVFLDNLLLRIPVLAGASVGEDLIYYGVHRLLGQTSTEPVLTTIAYTLIGTTIVGTMMFFFLENANSQAAKAKRREFFAPKRQTRRRNPIRLGRRG